MAMKRANGDGSVYKIGGKRRKPYGARITIGWKLDPENGRSHQIYQSIGTYATRIEAENALNNYLQNPYDIDTHKITFSGVYDMWSAEYYETLKNPSSARTYTAAYRYCEPIYNMRMRDLRVNHLQGVIKDANVGEATKSRMKSLFNLMYKYALIHEIVDKDYSALFVHKAGKRNKENRKPFTVNEISILWQYEDLYFVDLILFGLYTGFRPTEIVLLETKNINLDAGLMIGGIKTEAGTNRTVPIHPKIRHIVEKHYNPAFERLFMNERMENMTYDQFRGRFKHIMHRFKMEHTPHETRHTFITNAKHKQMPDAILKQIVGHEVWDITDAVYTHYTNSDLITGISLIDYSNEV